MTKPELRQQMRVALRAVGESRAEKSRVIVASILECVAFCSGSGTGVPPVAAGVSPAKLVADLVRGRDARDDRRDACPTFASTAVTLALFDPLPEEPDVALVWGKFAGRIAYPRVVGEGLVFLEVRAPEELRPADWNAKIREPVFASSRVILPAQIDVIIVPGLAFTPEGYRLGRGGGFYDRLLAQLPTTTKKLGVCFDVQLMASLPCEPHDQPVDVVVTESGIFSPRQTRTHMD